MTNINFIYTENGEPKSSLAEHQRRVEILEHNQRITNWFNKAVNEKETLTKECDETMERDDLTPEIE